MFLSRRGLLSSVTAWLPSKSTYVEFNMPPERLLAPWHKVGQQANQAHRGFVDGSEWPFGGGEMGDRIRAFDWPATPLGPLTSWPQSLRTVVDMMLCSAQPIYIAWSAGHISLHNDAYIPILGDKHPGALGQPFRALWGEVWDEYQPHVKAAFEGHAQHWQDQPIKLAGRPERPISWFTFSWTPVRDESGTVTGLFCSAVETTDRVLAEHDLVQSMDEGFAVLDLEFAADGAPIDWRHLQTNVAFEAQSGLHGAVGRSIRDMVPDIETVWMEKAGRAARTGEASRFVAEIAALGKWFDAYVFRYGGRHGSSVGLLFRDVSAQHHSEQELRRNQLRMDAALSLAKIGIFEWDLRTNLVKCSERTREIFGFSPEEGRAAADYYGRILPEDLARVQYSHAESFAGDGRVKVSYRIRLPGGGIRFIDSIRAIYRDERGEWERIEGVLKDVTDRTLSEARQEEESRRKDEFLAMLAHELRNPLAPISAAAALLQMPGVDPGRVKSASAVISRQVRHLTGLVDDLLDVSRVTQGLVTLDRSPQDARRLVSEAIEQARPLIDAQRHGLALEICAEVAIVDADPTRLVQVIVNLLTNAARYTPAGGHLVLKVETDQVVRITVTDDGQGMSAGLLERCFDLFVQADRSSDRRQGGLGIGLALVKSLVELHGGHVTAESSGIGQGSRFTVTLPRAGSLHLHAPFMTEAPHVMRARRKVLVLDDNKDAAESLGMVLESIGHEVLLEFHPHSALERIREEAPDVCLVDIGLPEMDGYELATAVRSTGNGRPIILIAVTGYGQPQDIQRALAAGFDHHMLKPIEVNRLVELLNAKAPALQTLP